MESRKLFLIESGGGQSSEMMDLVPNSCLLLPGSTKIQPGRKDLDALRIAVCPWASGCPFQA